MNTRVYPGGTGIGQSVERLEDLPLVTGRGNFIADVNFPHQLHMRIVRSSHAHGKILAINTDAAKQLPGVVAVWTGADVSDIPCISPRPGDKGGSLDAYCQRILALAKVRYVGDPVAAIFATDPHIAEDAADLVDVSVEELPPLLSATQPICEFDPGLTSEPRVIRQGYGDVKAQLEKAHTVIELKLDIGRHSGVPMETRGAIGRYDMSRDVLELWGAAKVPHRNQEQLSRMLNRTPSSLHLHEVHVGGGFGVRGEIYPEDVLVLVAALRLKRPVKWIEDRAENLIATNHSRQQTHFVRAAADKDGHLLAITNEFYHDQGAYVRTIESRVVELTTAFVPGPYKLPAYEATGHFRLTNKTPAGTYRSPGLYESCFVGERVLDAIAAKLGLDPVEIRRRNLVTSVNLPYEIPLAVGGEQLCYDSGDIEKLLDGALARAGWEEMQSSAKSRRDANECVGVGISMHVEKGGQGPRDGVRIQIDSGGIVEVITGGASVGQGFETVMAQITSSALGIDYRNVRVTHGHTDRIPFGVGAHASRASILIGSATHVAALKLREKILEVASIQMQVPISELVIAEGVVARSGSPRGPRMTFAEIAAKVAPTVKKIAHLEPGLYCEGWFEAEHKTYSFGVHIAQVRVDKDTGHVEIEKYLVAFDVGRALNPMLCEGQLVGGCVQGIGGALFEEFTYDDQGQPLSTTFADYTLPAMKEVPLVEILLTEEHPTKRNPLGIKGVGEAGVTGVGAAIAAAVDDAVGVRGLVTSIPLFPQRLHASIKATAP